MRKPSLATIFLIVFVDLMGFGIVMPNLQLYGQEFGINSYFVLTLIGAVYSIFQFVFSPLLGKWSDRIGRRPVLLISQAGTLFGFLLLFLAHWFEGPQASVGIALIFASRIIDGISGGNISTASAYIADSTTPENRAKGMGMLGAAFGLGFMFGPVIGGLVAYYAGLAWVPIAAAVFSAAALTMTFLYLPESLDPAHQTSPGELRRYSVHAIVHALGRPSIGPMILMGFVNGFAFAGMEQTYSLLVRLRVFGVSTDMFAKSIRDHSAEESSRATGFLFFMIGMILVIVQGGLIHRLIKKFGEARLIIFGPLSIATGLFIIAADLPRLIPGLWTWTGFVLGSAFMAAGASCFNPSLQSLISRHAGPREQGEVLGASQGMASLARALGPMCAGLLFQFVMPGTVWQGAAPYWVSGTMCVIVGVWAMGMRGKLVPPVKSAADTSVGPMKPVSAMDAKEWE